MGRQKRKQMKPRRLSKRKTEADRADQHDLYQKSVQAPEADIERVARLTQSHVLLPHLNGKWWYEVHPLATPFIT